MANHTENVGINYCGLVAEKQKWFFRHQPTNDIGIDAHIEYVDTSGKSIQLLALQIKSGTSWFKEKKDDYIVFRDIDERQYNYWTMNTLPCIVVLYDEENDLCIWQKLTKDTIKKTKNGKGKGFSVKVPLKQIFLDENSKKQLLSFTNLPEHITNYNFLLSQKKFMQIIEQGGEIKLHATEWVNKSSGRGETKLIVDNGISIEEYEYPYWFPYTQYTTVFPKLFPWAEFKADEDFFEDSDYSLWQELHCHYDNEDDEWIPVGDTFENFREKLDPMRYLDHAGEVAEYMMILNLNELGKAFLTTEKFISKNQPYSIARPNEKEIKTNEKN